MVPALAPRVVVITLAVLGGTILLSGSVLSSGSALPSASAQTERSTSDSYALEMLARAMTAPSFVSYSGTQFVAAWSATDPSASTSMMADVEHTAGGSTVVRPHGSAEAARVDPPDSAAWLASAGPMDMLTDAHTLAVSGTADIAGRGTVVIDALRHNGTVVARLWLDEETALPLRREVYDDSGMVVRASAFVDITFSDDGVARADLTGRESPTWSERAKTLGNTDLDHLRAAGWTCPSTLASGLTLYEAKEVGSAIQLSYTDGVGAMSVFEQPGRLDTDAVAGFTVHEAGDGVYYRAPGPPTRFVWESQGYVVTVITDAPAMVDAVLTAMPPEAGESSGLLARVGRGAQRLMSWVNPFD